MFKAKDLFDFKLLNLLRFVLQLEWLKGTVGFAAFIEWSNIKKFTICVMLLKVAFSLHIKWIHCKSC